MIPTRQYIESLKVGDVVLNCFGVPSEITIINYRGLDINGKMFVHYDTKFGETSTLSGSMKESEELRIVK